MFYMSESAKHLYTFRVTRPASPTSRPAPVTFEHSVEAASPLEAHGAILRPEPLNTVAELLRVSKAGDGCGDDRCSICNPSSRNTGTL